MKYRFFIPVLLTALIALLMGCEKENSEKNTTGEIAIDSIAHEVSEDYTYDTNNVVYISLEGNTATINGTGATVSGSIVTIAVGGTYFVSGILNDGQLLVNAADTESVKLVLNGADIHCASSAPLYIKKSGKTIILLAGGSENTLSDGTSYQYDNTEEEEPNAALFSKSDLSIYGGGSLSVDANFKDGISSKDGLIIKSGTFLINAVDNGIRGKDYLIIRDGDISVESGSNGLKSDDESTGTGYINIESGNIKVTATGDAITAQSDLVITGGCFNLLSGGGSSRSVTTATSAKGVKALLTASINCDTMIVSSADDALHSNGSLIINGGVFYLSSADDGMHADAEVSINDSEVGISKSYEGIESASITVENSYVSIVASDDGFNATQGSATEYNDNSNLNILSGYVVVNASGGDGLDSNGNITFSGGTVIVHGPARTPEVGMDYNGTCKISGGWLVISGPTTNMVQAPGTSSTQNAVLITLSSGQTSNSLIHIGDAAGNELLTFAPMRAYQTVVFSSPDLVKNTTYTVYTGGTSTGTINDGLYTGGEYTPGSTYKSFTVSSVITSVGSGSTQPGGRP